LPTAPIALLSRLAADHDVVYPTIYRDLEALQAAGFPLFDERVDRKVLLRSAGRRSRACASTASASPETVLVLRQTGRGSRRRAVAQSTRISMSAIKEADGSPRPQDATVPGPAERVPDVEARAGQKRRQHGPLAAPEELVRSDPGTPDARDDLNHSFSVAK